MKLKQLKAMTAWTLILTMAMSAPGFAALADAIPLDGILGTDYKLVKLNAGDQATFSNALKASPNDASPSDLVPASPSKVTWLKVDSGDEVYLGEEEGEGDVFYLDEEALNKAVYQDADLTYDSQKDKKAFWLESPGEFDSEIKFDYETGDGYKLTKNITPLYLELADWIDTESIEQLRDGWAAVMGLPEDRTMDISDIEDADRYSQNELMEALKTSPDTYSGVDAEHALQLSMDMDSYTGDVKVRMRLPHEFSDVTADKSLVVIQFVKNSAPKIITPEETCDFDGLITEIGFHLNASGPVVIAPVDKMVEVTVENVPGGFVMAWSGDYWASDEEGNHTPVTFLPIGETVRLPKGTQLSVDSVGLDDAVLKEFTVSEDGQERLLPDADAGEFEFRVTADHTTFTGEFTEASWGESEYGYNIKMEPDQFEADSKVKTQLTLVRYSEDAPKGQELEGEWTLDETSDPDSGENHNDEFTLSPDGILESNASLPAGFYRIDPTFVDQDGVTYGRRIWIEVGIYTSFRMYMGYYSNGTGKTILDSYLDDCMAENETSFGEIKNMVGYQDWTPGLYGYEFDSWAGLSRGKLRKMQDTDLITEETIFYARFRNADGYYDPEILPLGAAEKPDVPNKPGNSGSSDSSSDSSVSSSTLTDTISGTWEKSEQGWRFQLSDGTYAANQWGMIHGVWYFFGADTYMDTGWIFWNNRWYYLNQTKGSEEGAMFTGWQQIDGKWYYLNPVSDGTRGAMLSDQWVGDYYLSPDGSWIEGKTK